MSTQTTHASAIRHTPGPWSWQRMPHRFRLLSAKGEPTGLAVKVLEAEDEMFPHSANARLIASAPDMLKLLNEAMKLMPLGTKIRAEWLERATALKETLK